MHLGPCRALRPWHHQLLGQAFDFVPWLTQHEERPVRCSLQTPPTRNPPCLPVWRFPLVLTLVQSGRETWPDMPAYRAVAVALGRAGRLKELLQVRMGLCSCLGQVIVR